MNRCWLDPRSWGAVRSTGSWTTTDRVTLDDTHTRGPGLAVKHEVGYGGNSYYGWGEQLLLGADLVRPRLRLVRLAPGRRRAPDPSAGRSDSLRFAIDVLESGRLSLKDSQNRTIVTTSSSILTGGWVRIEWMVNQPAGSVTILLFNSPNDTDPTETLLSPDGVSIGPDTDQVQIGRSGSQRYSTEFWTDDPAIGTGGFLGPVP